MTMVMDVTSEAQTAHPPVKVLGFTIPVSPHGRRMWTVEFKNEVKRKLAEREMTARQIASACGVSTKTVSKWKAIPARKAGRPSLARPKPDRPEGDRIPFVELGISDPSSTEYGELRLRYGELELSLPENYPTGRLTELMKALGTAT